MTLASPGEASTRRASPSTLTVAAPSAGASARAAPRAMRPAVDRMRSPDHRPARLALELPSERLEVGFRFAIVAVATRRMPAGCGSGRSVLGRRGALRAAAQVLAHVPGPELHHIAV